MRLLIGAMAATISVALAVAALAQSATAPTPAPAVAPAPANTAAPAEPVPSGKRFACQTAAQGFKGQERQDQMQLCIAQAHIDCLKQAIDQKIVGPQRRDFVKSCAE
jgi:curli biogenesis system outer membrane secretion channel CsgG